MILMSYLNGFAWGMLLLYLIFFYLFYPLLILISIQNGIGFTRFFKWLKKYCLKWLSKSLIPLIVLAVILNHILYSILFTYSTNDSFIFYILLFAIGSLISATLGSFIHSTLGYFTGSYGTGTALIVYGILLPPSFTIENSGILYLIVVLLSLYAGVIAGRLSRGVINYGFTASTIDIYFNDISPELAGDLENKILSIGEDTFSKPFFDNIKPYKTKKSFFSDNVIIFESGVSRSIYGNVLRKNCGISFNVELVNKIHPCLILLKKLKSNEKLVSRLTLKIPCKDIQKSDLIYHNNRYYKILDKKVENESIEIKIEDVFSNKRESLSLRKEQSIYLSVKFVPEITDTILNTFADVNSNISVNVDFLEKSVHFRILTDERTGTKKYVTPYSLERAFEVHDALLKEFQKHDVKEIKETRPYRIYNKKVQNYLNNLDFESNFISNLDITSLDLNNDKIKLINSIPKSYLDNSSYDKFKSVFFAAISSIITTSVGIVINMIISNQLI